MRTVVGGGTPGGTPESLEKMNCNYKVREKNDGSNPAVRMEARASGRTYLRRRTEGKNGRRMYKTRTVVGGRNPLRNPRRIPMRA